MLASVPRGTPRWSAPVVAAPDPAFSSGLPGWGAKSCAAVLRKFFHLESIPKDSRDWAVNVANAGALADTLRNEWENALLFRTLATLRTDLKLFDDVDELRWLGPKPEFDDWRWASLDEMPRLAVAFKRPVYDAVAEQFAEYAQPVGARTAALVGA